MKQLQPCMTEREGGLMSCFLPLALLQRNTVKQKTCALSSFLLLIFIKTVQGYFSSLASNTTFTVFRECNSYKLIWQKISSLVIPHLAINFCRNIRGGKNLDWKVWSGLHKLTLSTFQCWRLRQWGKEIIIFGTTDTWGTVLHITELSISMSEKGFNLKSMVSEAKNKQQNR